MQEIKEYFDANKYANAYLLTEAKGFTIWKKKST